MRKSRFGESATLVTHGCHSPIEPPGPTRFKSRCDQHAPKIGRERLDDCPEKLAYASGGGHSERSPERDACCRFHDIRASGLGADGTQ